jgi:hypothetical protein
MSEIRRITESELIQTIPHSVCPHCLHTLDSVLPCEPLYDLAVACEIIPITYAGIIKWLSLSDWPKRYRRIHIKKRCRLLTAQEIRTIRTRSLLYRNRDGTKREADSQGL